MPKPPTETVRIDENRPASQCTRPSEYRFENRKLTLCVYNDNTDSVQHDNLFPATCMFCNPNKAKPIIRSVRIPTRPISEETSLSLAIRKHYQATSFLSSCINNSYSRSREMVCNTLKKNTRLQTRIARQKPCRQNRETHLPSSSFKHCDEVLPNLNTTLKQSTLKPWQNLPNVQAYTQRFFKNISCLWEKYCTPTREKPASTNPAPPKTTTKRASKTHVIPTTSTREKPTATNPAPPKTTTEKTPDVISTNKEHFANIPFVISLTVGVWYSIFAVWKKLAVIRKASTQKQQQNNAVNGENSREEENVLSRLNGETNL